MTWTVLCSAEDQSNSAGEPLPIEHFGLQLFPALAGKGVKLGFATRVCLPPIGVEPAAVFEAVQSGVEGTLLELKEIFGDLLNALGDRVAVNGAQSHDLEDEHAQRAFEQFRFVLSHADT